MTHPKHRRRLARRLRCARAALCASAAALALSGVVLPGLARPAVAADAYRAVTGSGSTWSANMVEQWTADVKQFGISVNFSATGSSTGRREFSAGTVDFAVSEIPYGLTDAQGGYDKPPARDFAYLPIVAGGTSFMYNLKVAGQRVTNLRLSEANTTKIFTGVITMWNDPALVEDNPGIPLPARRIIPVVRSDGSGTTAQFTTWMAKEQPQLWSEFCQRQGVRYSGSCPFTSNYPSAQGFVSQSGSLGVAGYVASNTAEGAITYVEYSYALRSQFPVAKILNSSGYYVQPDDQAVAVGLLGARINNDSSNRDTYLTQDLSGVYRNPDPRSYPLSSYSYMIIPTAVGGTFKADKGRALGDFLYYSICEGQQAAGVLGYSPLPQNLVQAGLEQIKLIPGVQVERVQLSDCNNPTFSRDGTNTLAKNAPQPPACDRVGPTQCGSGNDGEAAAGGGASPGTDAGGASGGTVGPVDAGAGGGTGSGTDPGQPGAGGSGGVALAPGSSGTPGAAAPGGIDGTQVVVDPETGQLVAAVDPVTGQVLAAVDPETGQLVQGGASGTSAAGGAVAAGAAGGRRLAGNLSLGRGAGTSLVSGIAVSAPGATGTAMQTWFMALAALCLLMATVGPPLLLQRFAPDVRP